MTPTQSIEKLSKELSTHDLDVNRIARIVYAHPKFELWSGSSKPTQHHYGKGQLAQHTWEVIETSIMMNEYYQTKEPKAKIFLAALYHDFGKIWDYKPTLITNVIVDYNVWSSTPHKQTIHHLPKSAIEWCKSVQACSVYVDCDFSKWEDDITHAILSHHGLREWGSPVQPQNKLAWILHLCDNTSARVYES